VELKFKHRGKLGDIIWSLNFVKDLGGGKLYLQLGEYLDEAGFQFIKPLIEYQPYITEVIKWNGEEVDYDLDRFRVVMNKTHQRSLCESYYVVFNKPVPRNFEQSPWLTVPPLPDYRSSVIISRVERGLHGTRPVHNSFYDDLVKRNLQLSAYFVGLDSEWKRFVEEYQCNIAFRPVNNALELAQIIDQTKLCVMNQSMPAVIAEGLKKTMFVELRHDIAKPDHMFTRPNLFYI
jgi:hypothetical protein